MMTGPHPHLRHLPLYLTQLVIKAMRFLVAAIPLDHLVAVALVEVCRVIQFMLVDGNDLLLVEPLHSLAVLPQTILDLVLLHDQVGAETVLLALVPVTLVTPAVSPDVDTETVLFVVLILAFVLSTIIPDINSQTFHIIVLPFSFKLSTI